jgi:MraZ protein
VQTGGKPACWRVLAGWVSVLDRFVANFTNRLDSKGRVSIPASFRAVLAKDGFEGLYIHPSLDQQALDCGGHALIRQVDGLLEHFRPYTPEHDVYSVALMGVSETLKVDAEGRIILTDSLKDFAGITSEVTFVGQGYKFQIWEPARFRSHLEEARNQVRELRKQLGARHVGASPDIGPDPARPQPRGVQE